MPEATAAEIPAHREPFSDQARLALENVSLRRDIVRLTAELEAARCLIEQRKILSRRGTFVPWAAVIIGFAAMTAALILVGIALYESQPFWSSLVRQMLSVLY